MRIKILQIIVSLVVLIVTVFYTSPRDSELYVLLAPIFASFFMFQGIFSLIFTNSKFLISKVSKLVSSIVLSAVLTIFLIMSSLGQLSVFVVLLTTLFTALLLFYIKKIGL